jgi:hypothetical protein
MANGATRVIGKSGECKEAVDKLKRSKRGMMDVIIFWSNKSGVEYTRRRIVACRNVSVSAYWSVQCITVSNWHCVSGKPPEPRSNLILLRT